MGRVDRGKALVPLRLKRLAGPISNPQPLPATVFFLPPPPRSSSPPHRVSLAPFPVILSECPTEPVQTRLIVVSRLSVHPSHTLTLYHSNSPQLPLAPVRRTHPFRDQTHKDQTGSSPHRQRLCRRSPLAHPQCRTIPPHRTSLQTRPPDHPPNPTRQGGAIRSRGRA